MKRPRSATGCELHLDEQETYLDLRSNAVLAQRASVHLAAVGLEEDRVVPWERTGSTDVGDVSYAAPTLHPEFAIADAGIGPHTHAFREAALSPRGESAMLQAVEVLGRIGADVIFDRDVRAPCVMPFSPSRITAPSGPDRESRRAGTLWSEL